MDKVGALKDRFIILGHTGFLGNALLEAFRTKFPNCETLGLSSQQIDLTQDSSVLKLRSYLDANTTLIVFSGIKKQLGDSIDIYSKNTAISLNLCKALESVVLKKLIYISSADVYGDQEQKSAINECTPVNPTSFYGIAKYATEQLLYKVLGESRKFPLVILRPPLIYGVGDRSRGYGPTGFIWSAINSEKLILWGDGSELRQFIYIEDFTNIVCRLIPTDFRGILNISNELSSTFMQVVDFINEILPNHLVIESRPRSKSKIDNIFSNDLLRSLFPDFVFTTLNEGLRKTLFSFQNNKVENLR